MEYLLNDTWTLYFHAKDTNKKYNDNTSKVIDISTIADFWGTFNNFPKPLEMFSEYGKTKIVKRTNETPGALSFFRKNSYPTWEHESNTNGFEWSFRKYKDFEDTNTLWEKLLLTVVSENFEHADIINGIRIVDCSVDYRITYRIEVWLSDKNYKEFFDTKIKQILEIPQFIKLLYRDHSTLKEK